jgi:AraC family transcriptional regulator
MQFQADEKYEQALLAALIYIQTHLDGDLSLERLAERAGFSPYHFHRVFRAFVGEPVKEYTRRLRLERGAYRLKISQESVLHIALESGFKTHESFTRAFTRRFGINPSRFRTDFLVHDRKRRRQMDTTRQHTSVVEPGLFDHSASEMRVRFERVKPITVAFIRHTGPYDGLLEPGSSLASLWDELFRWGNPRGLTGPDSLLIGIGHDDPSVTPPDKLRFDVCVQLLEFREPIGSIGCQTISPGMYAAGRHYGLFDDLADAYVRTYDAAVANGQYRLRPLPSFEVYGSTRVRDDLRIHFTDVYMPVEPANGTSQEESESWQASK